MGRFSPPRALLALIVAMLGLAPLSVIAQDATPGADGGSAIIVASGLTNPRGLAWDADGVLYVGIAGAGSVAAAAPEDATPSDIDANDATDSTPVVEGAGEVQIGTETAGVVRIEDGCPVDVVTGVASGGPPELGWALGIDDLAVLDGTLYGVLGGGGETYGHPDSPNGVYAIDFDGTMTLVADLSAWFRANPVAQPWESVSPDAQPFGMVASEGLLWIAEANHQQVLTVAPDGTVARVTDLSVVGNVAPAGIAPAPEGGVYVGYLSALPFANGSAKVVHVSASGEVTDAWTNLTTVTSVAVGPDGALYALEMATDNIAEPPFVNPGTGKVVRQTGPDTAEEVVTGLNFPIKMEFGPDGALYVASPAFGANNGEGNVYRFDVSSGLPITVSDVAASTVDCAS